MLDRTDLFILLPRSTNVSPTCTELGECRTLLSIVWSCASVIIACTWAAVHPNIPPRDYGFWARKFTRVGITIVGLVAPELILIWAALQRFSAGRIRDQLNSMDENGSNEPWRANGIYGSHWSHRSSPISPSTNYLPLCHAIA